MIRMNVLICFTCILGIASAQEAGPAATAVDSRARITKMVRIKYQSPRSLAHLLEGSVITRSDDDLKAVVLMGEAAQVNAVEQTIHELDVPSTEPKNTKDIEVVATVIGGSNGLENPGGSTTSENDSPVIRQLRAVFPYKNYQSLGSMLLRSREGAKSENKGSLRNIANAASSGYPVGYAIRYGSAGVSSEGGKPLIHLHDFEFDMGVPVVSGSPTSQQIQKLEIAINTTDVDLREGQKVVIGKANMESSDSAVFVVLTARLVE